VGEVKKFGSYMEEYKEASGKYVEKLIKPTKVESPTTTSS
jgi:hypothetical protein